MVYRSGPGQSGTVIEALYCNRIICVCSSSRWAFKLAGGHCGHSIRFQERTCFCGIAGGVHFQSGIRVDTIFSV